MEHAVWLHKGAKGETLNIFDIPSTHDMYVRKDVSLEESFKVGGIDLDVQGRDKFLPQTTIAKVGLYEINQTMEEWCDDKMHTLTSLRTEKGEPLIRDEVLPVFNEKREWINDDSALVSKCLDDTKAKTNHSQVCLISRDKRTANQMANQTNNIVVLIDPKQLPKVFPDKVWNQDVTITCSDIWSAYSNNSKLSGRLRYPSHVYVDTGSLAACLCNMHANDETSCVRYYETSLIESGIKDDGHRFERYKEEELFLTSTLKVRIFDPNDKSTRKRKKKPLSRDSGSASRYDWSTDTSVSYTPRVTNRRADALL
jgi:hypothetical protein